MEKAIIHYGLVGFGGIAENRIAKEGFALDHTRFRDSLSIDLIGVTDINQNRKAAVDALGLRWYDSIDKLLARKMINAVYIATSNSSHAEIAKKALLAGKHVMIEKPLATNLFEAEELAALARQLKLSIGIDHMMTKNQYNLKAKDMITSGSLGKIDHIVLHMEFFYGSTPEEAASWRCSRPEELGGPIGDVGTHCMYMAEFLLDDRIVSLQCTYTPQTMPIAVECGAHIRFTTAKGISGTIRIAFDQPGGSLENTIKNLGYEVYGEKGTLRSRGTLFQFSGYQDEPAAQSLEQEIDSSTKYHYIDDITNIYQAQIAEHADSIRSKMLLDGEDALHNLKMVFACHTSAHEAGSLQQIPIKEDI